VSNNGHTNAPSADFIRSMLEVATMLKASIPRCECVGTTGRAGYDQEAMGLIGVAKGIQSAEVKVRRHAKDAGVVRIVKMSEH
jgi:hypothetical protein